MAGQSVLSQSRAEEREVPKERRSENIQAREHPERWVRVSDVNTALHEQECADREVRLIARDDRSTVNTPKCRTSGNPVHRATSEKCRPEQLDERVATRDWPEHPAHFLRREQQRRAKDGQAQRGRRHARTHAAMCPLLTQRPSVQWSAQRCASAAGHHEPVARRLQALVGRQIRA
jgi:hypothetical protein